MEFTRRVSWDAKFRWYNADKVWEKYTCLRHLRRILNKRELNCENIYFSAGSGCDARFGFVRVGEGHDHNARDHRDTTDSGTTDHNHSNKRRLLIRQNICLHRARIDLVARSFLGIV
jgi:hypothetical protein